STSLPDITLKAMGNLNEQIRLWNSICICTATTNRITGKDSFRWPSLLLTMLRVLQRVFLRSSLIQVITPTLQYTPTTYTRDYGPRYPRSKNVIKDPWAPVGRPLWISKSVISLSSRPHF